MYLCIDLYVLITYVFIQLLPLLLFFLLHLIYFCVYEAAHHLWMLLVFQFFPVILEAPPPSPSLVQNVRLLNSFLLLSWCTNISTSSRNE